MWRRVVVGTGVLGIAIACGRVSTPGRPSLAADAGTADAGAAGQLAGGAEGDPSDAGDSAGGAPSDDPSVELTLDVLRRRTSLWVAASGAHVRFEGNAGAVEVLSDEKGHVAARLDSKTGPWDVTVALAQHAAISILGVTGPINGPIHLGSLSPPLPEPTHSLSGKVSGTRSCLPSALGLSGRGVVGNSAQLASPPTQYTANILDAAGGAPLRLLAYETEPDTGSLLNAVWLDVPDSGGDLLADIHFPSPAREMTYTSMVLRVPTSGAVSATGLFGPPDIASRAGRGGSYRVGDSFAKRAASDPGRFDWTVHAFAGDMAPNQASLQLTDDSGRNLVIAAAPVSPGNVLTIPQADILEAEGDHVDTVSLNWDAPLYDLVGASLLAQEGGGAWFIYSYAHADATIRRWPHLPDGVGLYDIGLANEKDLVLNVFAANLLEDKQLWDWSARGDYLAVARRYRPFDGDGQGAFIVPSAPVDDQPRATFSCSLNGIYAIDSHTYNRDGCKTEGESLASVQRYFYAQLLPIGLSIVGCGSVSDCRAAAASDNSNGWFSFLATSDRPTPVSTRSLFGVSSPDPAGICKEAGFWTTSFSTFQGGVRVEQQILYIPPFGANKENQCTAELGAAAAAKTECSNLQILTGHYLEAL